MSSITDNQIGSPYPYIFMLSAYGKTCECRPYPLEWKECVYEISRDMNTGGMTSKVIIESLTFIGNGAAFLASVMQRYEITGEVFLNIGKWNYDTRVYDYYLTTFKVHLGSYKKVKVGDLVMGVNFALINSSITQKLLERKNVKLNVLSKTTIGGVDLEDLPNKVLTKVRFPQRISSFRAEWYEKCLPIDDVLYPLYTVSAGVNSVPLISMPSDFTESRHVSMETGQTSVLDLSPLFYQANEDKTLHLYYDVLYHVDHKYGTFFTDKDNVALKYAIYNGSTLVTSGNLPAIPLTGDKAEMATSVNPFGSTLGLNNVVGTIDINLNQGESIYIYTEVVDNSGQCHYLRPPKVYNRNETAISIKIVETVVNTAETVVEGLPLHEFFQKICALMFDDPYSFYSEYLGRLDSPYFKSQAGVYSYYSAENQERFAHIFAGTNVRGLSIDDENAAINTTFDEAFKSVSAAYGLGYCIEKATLGGVIRERLRIENLAFFFQDVQVLDLSDRLTQYDIEEEYMSEMAYVQIIGGYKNYVFKSKNGRGEFATETTRSVNVATSNDLDIQSEYGAATTMFTNCLEMPLSSFGSTDIDEDDKVLILKTQRDTATPTANAWKPEYEENVTIENDSSLFGTATLNLFFSPIWNLIRNALKIVPALAIEPLIKLKFRTTTKESNLETTYDGTTHNEKDDLIVGELPTPLVDPYRLRAAVELTPTEMKLYEANPYGYIKLTSTLNGYILKNNSKIGENKATIELIKKH